jgi:diaminohydroxyphosphoribosylaminopyrimidine deaminase/5-amino-6-(5-phosphoribosylamino)uracil reductase
MKAAMSLDGKLALSDGRSQWITGEESRREVHRLRHRVGAVIIGSGTLLQDDPQLNCRLLPDSRRRPVRVVLDSHLRMDESYRLVREEPGNTIVFCTREASAERENRLTKLGVQVIRQDHPGKVNLQDGLEAMGERGVQSVLIEGGGTIFSAFIAADLIDEYWLFYAPFFMGGTQSRGVFPGDELTDLSKRKDLEMVRTRTIAGDILVQAVKKGVLACLRD